METRKIVVQYGSTIEIIHSEPLPCEYEVSFGEHDKSLDLTLRKGDQVQINIDANARFLLHFKGRPESTIDT